MLKTWNIDVDSFENVKVLCPSMVDSNCHIQWYAVERSISHLIGTLYLLVSSFAFIFLCSFCLWMIWHSNAVWHIVSGLSVVQCLCGMSRALQQGSPPEILNVHRMCQAGSRKSFQWSLQRHYYYINVLLADKARLNRFVFSVSYKDRDSESYLTLYQHIWQVFRLMAAVWIDRTKPTLRARVVC